MELQFQFRHPDPEDGLRVWEIAENSKSLDVNSVYHYLIMCSHFKDTSCVVEVHGNIIGYVTAYSPPGSPDVLFIWQVAVSEAYRGHGLGLSLLLNVFKSSSFKYLHASITPSNEASIKLFTSAARALKAQHRFDEVLFDAQMFTPGDHEPEIIFNIGPVEDK